MSLALLGIPQSNYLGSVYNRPTNAFRKSNVAPQICIFTINWAAYNSGANVAILAGVQSAPSASLDVIKSVRIDNTGNPFPVYVIFPDTQDTIACAANSIETANCLTTSLTPVICCEGVGNATAVYFTNVFFSNELFQNQDSNLPVPNYTYNSSGILVPAVQPDLHATGIANFANPTTVIPANTYTGNIVIAGISAYVAAFPAGVSGEYEFILYQQSASPIQIFVFSVPANIPGILPLYSDSGTARRIPANTALTVALKSGTGNAGGLFVVDLNYSISPV